MNSGASCARGVPQRATGVSVGRGATQVRPEAGRYLEGRFAPPSDCHVAYIFQRLKDLISRGEDLPTLPTIVLQLHRVLDDPDAGVGEVAGIIEQDPALTARLLRAANSAAFARSSTAVTSVPAAVSRMGLNQVRAVCLVLAIVKAFGNRTGRLDHRVFWTHSATVAQIASALWDRVGIDPSITPDDAYVIGLLHDVGLLVIDQNFPVDFGVVLEARGNANTALWQLEEEHLGVDHGAVAGLLLGRWSLPPFVAEAVSHHHHPGLAPNACVEIAKVIAAAESMCWETGVGLPIEGRPIVTADAWLEELGLPPREIPDLIASTPRLHERAKGFLS